MILIGHALNQPEATLPPTHQEPCFSLKIRLRSSKKRFGMITHCSSLAVQKSTSLSLQHLTFAPEIVPEPQIGFAYNEFEAAWMPFFP
jgi:hypothetical protein